MQTSEAGSCYITPNIKILNFFVIQLFQNKINGIYSAYTHQHNIYFLNQLDSSSPAV